MPTQRSLFDAPVTGLDLARRGAQQALEHAPAEWKEAALNALRIVCLDHGSFVVDAVWQKLDEWHTARPHEGRAMGGVLAEGVQRGWCEKTNEYVRSEQRQNHANPRIKWRSLIYK